MSSFWIIAAIAVIQFVVRGLAKAAEARKKREQEAEALRSVPPTSRAAPASRTPASRTSATAEEPTITRSDRAIDAAERLADAMMQAAGVGSEEAPKKTKRKPDLDELRRRRVEALRRRQQGAAASVGIARTPPAAPPAAPPVMPPGPAGTTARRRTSAAPMPSTPVDRGPDVAPVPGESRAKAGAGLPATKAMLGGAGSGRRPGRAASRLQRRLRDPRSFREAFLLAELLKPPVALRRDQAEVGS